jgi:hypothetical protein
MKSIIIDLVYKDIENQRVTEDKSLVIEYMNGDRLTLKPSPYTTRLSNHLSRTFNGEHF